MLPQLSMASVLWCRDDSVSAVTLIFFRGGGGNCGRGTTRAQASAELPRLLHNSAVIVEADGMHSVVPILRP